MKKQTNHAQNSGATTIVVVCVMTVIMALSMGLFLTASVLMRTAGRTLAGEQCRILAVSFSEEIRSTLTSDQFDYENRMQEEAGRAGSMTGISFWHYVKQNIVDGSWPSYKEDGGLIHSKSNAVRTFSMESIGAAEGIADIELSIYWTEGDEMGIPNNLFVETSVTIREQTCTITDVYVLDRNWVGDYNKWSWVHAEKR